MHSPLYYRTLGNKYLDIILLVNIMHSIILAYRKSKKDLEVVRKMYKEYQSTFERDFAEDIALIEEALSRQRQQYVMQAEAAAASAVRQNDVPTEPPLGLNENEPQPRPTKVGLNFEVHDEERPSCQEGHGPENVAPVYEYEPKESGPKESGRETQEAAPKYKASKGSIKKLYRLLCKKFHPDNNLGDETYNSTFVEIQKTYEAGNEPGLIEIGIEQGINMEPYIENPDELCSHWTLKIDEAQKEINHLQATIVWIWNVTTDERKRKEMRPHMINKIRERALDA
jgi:hypothetical protein